ncbi:anthranilate synthase component II [Haladaptatus paucihalophilus DX253]|uniref:anthranilate synthase n=1 Tax=Haladaptatus paucihalophilus DX253 TaxID=797209 RepID=E7QUX6_HALPU|nr:aminodeoxychorismate/anthranilate synthase component II [Haladaptatus paucihalophilus]EFW91783.1 anthranilate synthase component II [Haladaptatus paucihalophilus DX253]SHJ94099.1 anthranilate synthase component 2 [Haladaptatus paucihalophilus DX253]
MILVIDNYDSFAYNLVQYIGEFAEEIVVRRNDAITIDEIRELDPDGIVVSPGPGTPQEAGVSIPIFEETRIPALGVCLGHQALCAAEGATVGHAPEVVHGKSSEINHDGKGIYEGVPSPFRVGRYHSLAVQSGTLPDSLRVTGNTKGDEDERVVMSVRHESKPHIGIQYHPESVLTPPGKRLIRTFCRKCRTDSFPDV